MFANLSYAVSMSRGDLSNDQWERLQPLLPPQKQRTGRPALDHRQIVNGILWIDRTGAPWRDLPQRYGAWSTVASRFYRWQKVGIWEQVLGRLQEQSDAAGQLDWKQHYIDSTIVRAHQHAAGAKRGSQKQKHLVEVVEDLALKSTCERRGRANQSHLS